jgi:hypothetical protein
MMAGSLGAGLFMATGCTQEDRKLSEQIIFENGGGDGYGRTDAEKKLDEQLHSETFFTESEKEMVAVLSDIIIPADEVSGSATDTGVVEFIEFMMKDYPPFQVPTRGGLMWLNTLCKKEYGTDFLSCSSEQRVEVIDRIAFGFSTGCAILFLPDFSHPKWELKIWITEEIAPTSGMVFLMRFLPNMASRMMKRR